MSESEKRNLFQNLDEFEFINRIDEKNKKLIQNEKIKKGIGDDTAVIEKDDKTYQLITKDMLVEGVHFDLTYAPLKHLGYKSVAVNISDICAMNGKPQYILLGLALSSKYTKEAVDELIEGMLLACKLYNVNLVGGDTTTIGAGMVISITCVGEVAREKIVYRSGAQDKDLIYTTGYLGSAFAGLQILNREKKKFIEDNSYKPNIEKSPYVLECQLKPEPRLDIIRWLDKEKITPTSMIDISDGLSSDLIHLCKASNKGCVIFKENIPVHEETQNVCKEIQLDITDVALNGGEDYELLFTIKQEDYEKIKNEKKIHPIGYITDEPEEYKLIGKKEEKTDIKPEGWKSF